MLPAPPPPRTLMVTLNSELSTICYYFILLTGAVRYINLQQNQRFVAFYLQLRNKSCVIKGWSAMMYLYSHWPTTTDYRCPIKFSVYQ